ncbi:GDP-mannose 4,6-dehydratase [Paenibacillus sp. D2_2]|nr:GDP-mannose 4,6-dehydratase [Paenibacillus sp. D2_2]WMT41225.1 GDP-mannose 4,6-dehydratase [Paenibacillus sp. D2_2]
MKRALVTGITGQDGSYLAELLLEKGYKVYGLKRRTSTENYENIKHIQREIEFISGDLDDLSSLIQAVKQSNPDEVYNLGAQSFVADSWPQPVLRQRLQVLVYLECWKQLSRSSQMPVSTKLQVLKCLDG